MWLGFKPIFHCITVSVEVAYLALTTGQWPVYVCDKCRFSLSLVLSVWGSEMDLCWLDKSDFTTGNLIFGDYFPKFSRLFFRTFSTLANFLNFVLILKYWIKCKTQEQTSSKTCLGFEIRQQAKRLKWQKFLDREKLVSPLEQFAIMSESLIYGLRS